MSESKPKAPLGNILRGTCATCKHWDRSPEDDGTGICRANPPTACVIMQPQQNELTREVVMVPQIVAAFPPVPATAWCGTWTSRLEFTRSLS